MKHDTCWILHKLEIFNKLMGQTNNFDTVNIRFDILIVKINQID